MDASTREGLTEVHGVSVGPKCAEFTESQNGRGWKGPLWVI